MATPKSESGSVHGWGAVGREEVGVRVLWVLNATSGPAGSWVAVFRSGVRPQLHLSPGESQVVLLPLSHTCHSH